MSARLPDAKEAAHRYLDLGLEPLPIRHHSKAAKSSWQEPRTITHAWIDNAFEAGDNVAVALGARSSGLVDFDFDHPVAVEIADMLEDIGVLPPSPIFGRQSNPSSHRLFRCDDAGKIEVFSVSDDLASKIAAPKTKIVEVRGNGHYTVFPGSVHESGQSIEWETDKFDLPLLSWSEASRLGGLISFLVVMDNFYDLQGSRHDIGVALAGALTLADYEPDEVDAIVVAIAKRNNDEEAEQRRFASRTGERIANGAPVVGLAKLCELMGISEHKATLASWLHVNAEPGGRPTVQLIPGKLAVAVDQAEAALMQAGVPIYERGGQLVYPHRVEAGRNTQGNEPHVAEAQALEGALVLETVGEQWLLDKLGRHISFRKPARSREKSSIQCEPPLDLARRLIARKDEWSFPVIRGVVEAPTMRVDKSVLQEAGYDPLSRLLFDPGGAVFAPVAERPTREDAESALQRLVHPFRAFPFAPDEPDDQWTPCSTEGLNRSASRSVVLSAILTGLIRRSLITAPLHALDAPMAGSGKSLIADIISIVLCGRRASPMSWSRDEAENEKRLFSALLRGDTMLFIDNVRHPVESDALCSILTLPEWSCRILGVSKNATVSTASLFMANGNNLTFKGDMTRRVVVARLEPRVEKPAERQFEFDVCDEVRMTRPFLVRDALTILRAYVAAGHPMRGEVQNVGSFEGWTFVREALVWLDQPDPAISMRRVQEDDPERSDVQEVMAAWDEAFGARPTTARDALSYAFGGRVAGEDASGDRRKRLRLLAAFEQISFNAQPNAKKLGWWFKGKSGAIIDGKSFVSCGKDGHKSQLIRLNGGGKF